jgi:hypothetical protein
MRRLCLLYIFGLGCFSLVGAVGYFSFLSVEPTHLLPQRAKISLGNIYVGQIVEKDFLLTNPTSRPIDLICWIPSCHCVSARVGVGRIEPHDSIKAFVGSRGDWPLGERGAKLTFQWRFDGDSVVHEDSLRVVFNYVSCAFLPEQRIDFGEVDAASGAITKSIPVANGNIGEKWNDLKIISETNNVSVRLVKNEDSWQIESKLDPHGLPTGYWKTLLKAYSIRDGRNTGEEVDIPIIARIKNVFTVTPPVVQVHGDKLSDRYLFTLTIHSTGAAILKVNVLGGGVNIEDQKIVISDGGATATLSGCLLESTVDEIFVGRIPIQINHDPLGLINVSFVGIPYKAAGS